MLKLPALCKFTFYYQNIKTSIKRLKFLSKCCFGIEECLTQIKTIFSFCCTQGQAAKHSEQVMRRREKWGFARVMVAVKSNSDKAPGPTSNAHVRPSSWAPVASSPGHHARPLRPQAWQHLFTVVSALLRLRKTKCIHEV